MRRQLTLPTNRHSFFLDACTHYRADSLSSTPAAPPLRLSHANCVISSTSPPTPPSPQQLLPVRFLCIPHEVHFYCASAAVVQVRPRTYCCPPSCEIFLSPTYSMRVLPVDLCSCSYSSPLTSPWWETSTCMVNGHGCPEPQITGTLKKRKISERK